MTPELRWSDIWAIGRFDLGLSDFEVRWVTLKQFAALRRRHEEKNRRSDLRAGIIASTIANCAPFRSEGARVFAPSDFMPGEARPDPPPQTPEEMREAFRAFAKRRTVEMTDG